MVKIGYFYVDKSADIRFNITIMPKPRIEFTYKYLTSPQVCRVLGYGRAQLDERLKRGIFPEPTFVAPSGVRYFDQSWVKSVLEIIKNAPSNSMPAGSSE
jgi:predicted DNA-binding transcriptional regulator AlpA